MIDRRFLGMKTMASCAVLLFMLQGCGSVTKTDSPAEYSGPPTTSPAETGRARYSFGSQPRPGYMQVATDMNYTAERGFGFDSGSNLTTTGNAMVSDKPFFFSVTAPEANYRVTVKFGDAQNATDNTVNAELRRLMVENVHSEPGQTVTRSFIVNVRTPEIVGGGQVRLGGRERTSEVWAWDDRLSLEFNGARPGIQTIDIQKVDVPTIYILGDSTVCDQPREPFNSWGQMLTGFLKPDIAVSNGAESGDSIAPALGARRFDKFWAQMKPGDYLLIQFGHNDMKSTAPNAIETYRNNMRRAVDETRAHGGTPVLITSVSRRTFGPDGKITDSFKGYTQVVRDVAKEKSAPLIDLQNMGAAFYEAMGDEHSHVAFATAAENTHHSDYGSYEIAKCVVMGIKENHLDLAKHIVDDFKDFDPSKPDPFDGFTVPKSPLSTNMTPLGS